MSALGAQSCQFSSQAECGWAALAGDLLYPLRGPGLESRPIRVTIRSNWKVSGSFWGTRSVPHIWRCAPEGAAFLS
jgi:hypothetical protein